MKQFDTVVNDFNSGQFKTRMKKVAAQADLYFVIWSKKLVQVCGFNY